MKVFITFLIGFFLFSMDIYSQKRGVEIEEQTASDSVGNVYAIVIGISKYKNLPHLNYAHNDAIVFSNFLVQNIKNGINNVKTLINEEATWENDIYLNLETFIKKLKPNDLFFIYFAGHGGYEIPKVSDEREVYEEAMLFLWDIKTENFGKDRNSFINDNQLQSIIRRIVKKRATPILIVDACHSGGLTWSPNFTPNLWYKEIKIFSCEPEETSKESDMFSNGRGIFSYFLTQGLNGEIAKDKIRTSDIEDYIKPNVRKATDSTQNPIVLGSAKFILFDKSKFDKKEILRHSETVVSPGLDSASKIHEMFKKCLKNKCLFEPLTDCSYYYYKKYQSIEPHNENVLKIMLNELTKAAERRSDETTKSYLGKIDFQRAEHLLFPVNESSKFEDTAKNIYERFRICLQNENLFEPENNCCYYFYQKYKSLEHNNENIQSVMLNDIRKIVEKRTNNFFNDYLDGKLEDIDLNNIQDAYLAFDKILQEMNIDDIQYSLINTKKLFLSSFFEKDSISFTNLHLAIDNEYYSPFVLKRLAEKYFEIEEYDFGLKYLIRYKSSIPNDSCALFSVNLIANSFEAKFYENLINDLPTEEASTTVDYTTNVKYEENFYLKMNSYWFQSNLNNSLIIPSTSIKYLGLPITEDIINREQKKNILSSNNPLKIKKYYREYIEKFNRAEYEIIVNGENKEFIDEIIIDVRGPISGLKNGLKNRFIFEFGKTYEILIAAKGYGTQNINYLAKIEDFNTNFKLKITLKKDLSSSSYFENLVGKDLVIELNNKTNDKIKDLQSFIQIINNNSTDHTEKDMAIKQALDLFIPNSTIEVTNQSGKTRKLPIESYLKNLKYLKNSSVEIQNATLAFYNEPNFLVNGNTEVSVFAEQTYQGYDKLNNTTYYSDFIDRNYEVRLKSYKKVIDGEEKVNFGIFIGNISIKITPQLATNFDK